MFSRPALPRFLLCSLVASSAVTAAFAVPGCEGTIFGWYDDGFLGSDCAPGTPDRCCPCPWPEACVDERGTFVPKPIPWDCPNACEGALPLPPRCSDGGVDGGADGSISACTDGTCIVPPSAWAPAILASGRAIDELACPELAPVVAFEGWPEPTSAPECPACACDAPIGSCSISTTWTISSVACPNSDIGVKTTFDAPVGWDGTCNEEGAIVQGKQCGGAPCVASIAIDPPIIEESPCKPSGGLMPLDPPKLVAEGAFAPFSRACTAEPWPACGTSGAVCLPSPSADFATCVQHTGDVPCPEGWPDRHLLYGYMDDQRSCSECACLPPAGGICVMKAHLYSGLGCTAQTLEIDVSTDMSIGCSASLMPGAALSGKSAEVLDYQLGTCMPTGGELDGDLILADATTFCCLGPSTT
jgi:hypothetical protein